MQHHTEKLPPRHMTYWERIRRLTFALLAIWFLATFLVIFFARELSTFTLFGWPFSFYMAAQGLTLLYLGIVAFYALYTRRMDKHINNEKADVK